MWCKDMKKHCSPKEPNDCPLWQVCNRSGYRSDDAYDRMRDAGKLAQNVRVIRPGLSENQPDWRYRG